MTQKGCVCSGKQSKIVSKNAPSHGCVVQPTAQPQYPATLCWVDMNELDRTSILTRESLATTGNDKGTTVGNHDRPATMAICLKPPPYRICSLITVEPLVIFVNITGNIASLLTTQYIFEVITAEVGYNRSKTSRCSNASLPIEPMEQVQNILDMVTYSIVKLLYFFLIYLSWSLQVKAGA